jgi:hypothetical protein
VILKANRLTVFLKIVFFFLNRKTIQIMKKVIYGKGGVIIVISQRNECFQTHRLLDQKRNDTCT